MSMKAAGSESADDAPSVHHGPYDTTCAIAVILQFGTHLGIHCFFLPRVQPYTHSPSWRNETTQKHRHQTIKRVGMRNMVYPSPRPKTKTLVSLALLCRTAACGSQNPLRHATRAHTQTQASMDDLLIGIRCIGICEMWREGNGYGNVYGHFKRGQVSVPALPPGAEKKHKMKWNER